jgi:hypothetical protein
MKNRILGGLLVTCMLAGMAHAEQKETNVEIKMVKDSPSIIAHHIKRDISYLSLSVGKHDFLEWDMDVDFCLLQAKIQIHEGYMIYCRDTLVKMRTWVENEQRDPFPPLDS